MFRRKRRNPGQEGRKKRFWPILSAFLVLCYLAVAAWFTFIGTDKERKAENNADAPATAITATATPSPSPTPAPAPTPTVAPSPTSAIQKEDMEETAEAAPSPAPVPLGPAVEVRGLYISAWTAGMADGMARYIELCETTEINALVIDVKDDLGKITFATDTEGLSASSMNIIPDIEGLVESLKSSGAYTIARVVCFKDPLWSAKNPELAIQNTSGQLWKDGSGISWLNPYNTGAWEYIAAVALEAARVGFDEVQLDYVRFPLDGRLRDIDYGEAGGGKSKTEIISEFVAHIRELLRNEGVRLSADVFGIVAISSIDAEATGQDLGLLLSSADSLCPMIYPSHFANKKQNGEGQRINGILFEAPDLQPYEVVYNLLLELRRNLGDDGEQAVIRPYLQAFTASYLGTGYYQRYSAQQVRKQIQAVYDAGYDEWILWNHSSAYSEETFELSE